MKFSLVLLFVVVVSGFSRAGPADSMILAAMKLSEEMNYSWVSTVTDDARTYDIEGKTERGGFTWVRLPMIDSIAQRIGSRGDNEIQAVFRGARDFVILTENGWKTLAELPYRDRGRHEHYMTGGSAVQIGAGSLLNPDPFGRNGVYALPPPRWEKHRPYSNAQFGVSFPHEELGVIVSSSTALEVEGDTASGVLADLGAQLLLVRDGQEDVTPVTAAGRYQLWCKAGRVVRYSVKLEGILNVSGRRIHVQQSVVTEVRNVGATAVVAPEDARQKFSR
ncbi:MAG: hypothetical protein RIQ93_1715 [Verrucomicrobiota bacterium]